MSQPVRGDESNDHAGGYRKGQSFQPRGQSNMPPQGQMPPQQQRPPRAMNPQAHYPTHPQHQQYIYHPAQQPMYPGQYAYFYGGGYAPQMMAPMHPQQMMFSPQQQQQQHQQMSRPMMPQQSHIMSGMPMQHGQPQPQLAAPEMVSMATPPNAPITSPAAVAVATSSASAPALSTEAAAATPAVDSKPQRKKLSIKTQSGVEMSLDEIKKQPIVSKVEETPKIEEPLKVEEPPKVEEVVATPAPVEVQPVVVPTIPSMPVSIPAMPVSIPVTVAPVTVTEAVKPVEPVASNSPSPKLSPEPEEEKAVIASQDQSNARRLKPQANPVSKSFKKYSREDIMRLKPASLPQLDLIKELVTVKLDSMGGRGMDKGSGKGGGRSNNNNNSGSEWTRESVPVAHNKKRDIKSVPRPQQEVTDPLEALEQQVKDILNKIAPETFDSLTNQLLSIEIKHTSLMQRLVELIFEKATKDHSFSGMYAQLCSILKEKKPKNWCSHKVVKNIDENSYFWIKDYEFPLTASGPFFSKNEAIASIGPDAVDVDASQSAPTAPTAIEYLLVKQKCLAKLMTTNLASGEQYFVTVVNFDDISNELRASAIFETEENADADGYANASFRVALAKTCEKEFSESVSDENLFKSVDQELLDLVANRLSMSEEEYVNAESEVTEKRLKLKKRMIGCILFIGELYKQKLLNTDTMHSCIVKLLGEPGQWKPSYDPQDLELLCKLFTTLGAYLESKSKSMAKKKPQFERNFEAYIEHLAQLSKDKSIDTRIRFAMDDVVQLRKNGWKGREKVGPLKKSELLQLIQEEGKTPTEAPKVANAPAPSKPSDNRQRPGDRRDVRDSRDTRDSRDNRDRDGRDNRDAGRNRDMGRGGKSSGNANSTNNRTLNNSSNKAAGSSSSGKETAAPAPAAAAVQYDTLTFKDKDFEKRIKSSVDEFAQGEDISEVRAVLQDNAPVCFGYLIMVVIKKVRDTRGDNQRLLSMFDDKEIADGFAQQNGAIVEVALKQCDYLKQLIDSMCDYKEAPEKIASVVSIFVKKNWISMEKIEKIVAEIKAGNIADEICEPEEIEAGFHRFLSNLKA